MNEHPHHRHHHHPPGAKPARLIVFFIEAPTVPQEIDEQLDEIVDEALHLRGMFIRYFGPNVPDHLRVESARAVHEIQSFTKKIRGEVMKLAPTPIQPPAGAVNQLVIGDPVGILVAVLEADDSGTNFFPPVGPLSFNVQDPSSTVKQGVAADGVTPTFVDNGSGNTGNVSVTVTDQGNNLVGTASFAVVAKTPPPPEATQLGVFFVPAPSPGATAGSSGAGSGDAAAAAAAAKAAGVATTVDPHNAPK